MGNGKDDKRNRNDDKRNRDDDMRNRDDDMRSRNDDMRNRNGCNRGGNGSGVNGDGGSACGCSTVELKRMACLLRRYARIEAVDKVSYVLTVVVVSLVVMALGISAVFFLSSAFVLELSVLVGSEALASLIVGLGLIVLMSVVVVFRKSLIRDCVIRMMWRKGGGDDA